ncbi:hypothetical protein ANN_16170 [Periplaneta americana]|uniref:Uncharacterized protein n=1 Tax=Periplaneta americana TaxID=6978 RepID=A0ABQ8SI82_PERAM|nr:hypothetical protein ANN_16170 [Periplaneta americana]
MAGLCEGGNEPAGSLKAISRKSYFAPYFLPPRLNGKIYNFLQQVAPELLENVSLIMRQQMWMQQYEAPAHFTLLY